MNTKDKDRIEYLRVCIRLRKWQVAKRVLGTYGLNTNVFGWDLSADYADDRLINDYYEDIEKVINKLLPPKRKDYLFD